MDNLEKLVVVGTMVYGDNWQSPLSRDLGISDRTIRNFLSGSSRTPADLSGRLATAIEAKQAELDNAMKFINSDVINGGEVTTDLVDAIISQYDYRSERDRKNAIDAITNAIYEKTHLSDLEQIAKNWGRQIID